MDSDPRAGLNESEIRHLEGGCRVYNIDMTESRRRWDVIHSHVDDPNNPLCMGCARGPAAINVYVLYSAMDENDSIDVTDPEVVERAKQYVIHEEGTYNRKNGHFLCDDCYIKNGQPSSPNGWVCP